MTGGAGAPKITPDMLKSSKTIACDCGGMIFTEKLFFKKISQILSASGREEIAPMPIVVCDACRLVPAIFDQHDVLPSEMKAVSKE